MPFLTQPLLVASVDTQGGTVAEFWHPHAQDHLIINTLAVVLYEEFECVFHPPVYDNPWRCSILALLRNEEKMNSLQK